MRNLSADRIARERTRPDEREHPADWGEGMGRTIRILADRTALADALAGAVTRAAEASVAQRGRFAVALPGGSALDLLAEGVDRLTAAGGLRPDGTQWEVFWVDERFVPPDHPERNDRTARDGLLRRIGVPDSHIHPMDPLESPEATAAAYASRLAAFLTPSPGASPRFDLVLLGVGEDGHVASLFPGHPALEETRSWVVAVTGAPKPPPVRTSLSLPVLNAARQVFLAVSGSGKAPVLARLLGPSPGAMGPAPRPDDPVAPALPAARVRPDPGDAAWFLDRDAARMMKEDPA